MVIEVWMKVWFVFVVAMIVAVLLVKLVAVIFLPISRRMIARASRKAERKQRRREDILRFFPLPWLDAWDMCKQVSGCSGRLGILTAFLLKFRGGAPVPRLSMVAVNEFAAMVGRSSSDGDFAHAAAMLIPYAKMILGPIGFIPCPLCSKKMLAKKIDSGKHAGRIFLGCSEFPQCRGARKMAGEGRAAHDAVSLKTILG